MAGGIVAAIGGVGGRLPVPAVFPGGGSALGCDVAPGNGACTSNVGEFVTSDSGAGNPVGLDLAQAAQRVSRNQHVREALCDTGTNRMRCESMADLCMPVYACWVANPCTNLGFVDQR